MLDRKLINQLYDTAVKCYIEFQEFFPEVDYENNSKGEFVNGVVLIEERCKDMTMGVIDLIFSKYPELFMDAYSVASTYHNAHKTMRDNYSNYTYSAFRDICDTTDMTVPEKWTIDNMFNEDGHLDVAKLKDEYTEASEAELTRIAGLTNAILDLQVRSDGLVQRSAYLLWAIDSTQAYKCLGYKTLALYAKEVLGISSKGSISDAINTYKRFGETTGIIDWQSETAGQIRDKYREFKFSTLMRMKKLSDDEIDAMGITPTMSRSQVIQCINAGIADHAALEKKEREAKKATDGTLEKEIDDEIKKENSTVEQETEEREVQQADADTPTVCVQVARTYKNGENMDDYINSIVVRLREELERAVSGHEMVTVEFTLMQDVSTEDTI